MVIKLIPGIGIRVRVGASDSQFNRKRRAVMEVKPKEISEAIAKSSQAAEQHPRGALWVSFMMLSIGSMLLAAIAMQQGYIIKWNDHGVEVRRLK